MKLLKIFLLSAFAFALLPVCAQPSGLVGSWQLVKKSTCLDESASVQDDSLQALMDDMHGRSSATGQIVNFRGNSTAEESTRILNSSRTANQKKFYYKFNGEMLLILDKKSQTISDSYLVDRFSADSLILSNSSRPCETKIFVKIKEEQPN